MKVFKPTRKNLYPNIVNTFEKSEQWHVDNGYGPRNLTVDELISKFTVAVTNGVFTILMQDGGKKHHSNCQVMVFNKDGVLIDDCIYFNPVEGRKTPKKAFIGAPIIDGSKPMEFKPAKKKDKPFYPPTKS